MNAPFRASIGLLVWTITMVWFWQKLGKPGFSEMTQSPAMWIAGVCTLIVLAVCVPRLFMLPPGQKFSQGNNDSK